jgi:hypothetical protein
LTDKVTDAVYKSIVAFKEYTMSIINELASQTGARGGDTNRAVAAKCIDKPELLTEISASLGVKDVKIAGDCCEVMTEVAKLRPELIKTYAHLLPALFRHKNGRIQWEAMHCLALTAYLVPEVVQPRLAELMDIIKTSQGIIVRDYAIDTICNYALAGKQAAVEAYPLLKDCLDLWEGRHAAHVLTGFLAIIKLLPQNKAEIGVLALPYTTHAKGTISKIAKKVIKAC